jgi:outer membrane lipoprotein-sorting protein
MQSEPTNNRHAPTGTDADLKVAFRRSEPSFARVDIDAVLEDANASPVTTSVITEVSSGAPRSIRLPDPVSTVSESRRRIIMFGKVSALGICAASLCVALMFSLWSDNSVLAQVQDALKKVKTASYTMTQTMGDQPTQTWKVKLLGDSLCRVDQSNGIYLVFDIAGKNMMEVNPGESKARITENLPIPKDFNILAMLTDLNKSAAKVQPGVPTREIGGVTAIGFVVEENGITYNAWVDPKTNLPLEMEGERTGPLPDGKGGVKDQLVKERWTDFTFNEHLDEKLFLTQPPEGYAVDTQQARGNKAAEEKDRATHRLQRQKAAIEKAK